MAYRKQKPALYELLNQGNLRPNRDGRIGTPRWFYSGRSTGTSSRQDKAQNRPVDAPASPKPKAKKKLSFGGSEQIEFSLTRKLLLAGGAVVVISHLIAFWMGQSNKQEPSGTVVQESQQAQMTLKDVRQSPVRQDIFPDDVPTPTKPRVEAVRPAHAALANPRVTMELPKPAIPEEQQRATAGEPAELQTGIALVLCGYRSERELRPVQQYFNQNGVPTEIGKRQGAGRYELYTQETFDSRHNARLTAVKRQIARLGQGYNNHRPKTALIFDPETFASAFPINVEDMVRSNKPE